MGVYVRTEKHRRKISEGLKGHFVSAETRKKISKSNTGKHHSEETKTKMSKVHKGKIPWMKGKKHSEESKKKMRKSMKGRKASRTAFKKGHKTWITGKPFLAIRGENNPNWKGGVTYKNKAFRMRIEYKIWRKQVLERDSYMCQLCGETDNLHVHHILPYHVKKENFDVENGETTCKDCHIHLEQALRFGLERGVV